MRNRVRWGQSSSRALGRRRTLTPEHLHTVGTLHKGGKEALLTTDEEDSSTYPCPAKQIFALAYV